MGRTPRFFTFDPAGTTLVVANEDDDSLLGFDIERDRGLLKEGRLLAGTGSPVCVLFN
jgi:6-phosphogluconolactonase